MSELPSNVWEKLSNDFCGPFPSGYYLMVIIDEYPRYPVVESLTSLTAKSVIPLLDKTFSIFGIPKELISDNGPPFNSQEFRKFADNMGFKHIKITPLWPRANAESKWFMRTIGKAIRAAHTQHRSWKQEIRTFLRNYRAIPHATTDMSLKIKEKKGSMITAADGQNTMITRNSSHFKKVGESIMNEEEIEEISDSNYSDTPDITLRRSSRERRPPTNLDDYVCSK
jgi:transposase InsO family protein